MDDKKRMDKVRTILLLQKDLCGVFQMYCDELLTGHDIKADRIVESISYRVEERLRKFDE